MAALGVGIGRILLGSFSAPPGEEGTVETAEMVESIVVVRASGCGCELAARERWLEKADMSTSMALRSNTLSLRSRYRRERAWGLWGSE